MNCNWLYILLTLLAESNWTLAIQNNRQVLKRSQQEQDGNRVEVTGWHRYRQRDSGSAKVNWDVKEHRGEKWNQVHQKLIIVRPIVYAIHFLSPASIYSLASSLFWLLSRGPDLHRSRGSLTAPPPEKRRGEARARFLNSGWESRQFHSFFPERDSRFRVHCSGCLLSGQLFRELSAGLFLKLLNCVAWYIYNGRIFDDYLIS